MPSLTVVMIARNEVTRLADCIKSIEHIADDVVLGDTGSTDGTQELAESLGLKVISLPWNGDLSEVRNQCLQNVEGDWLFRIDADEVLDPAGAARIRKLVDEDAPAFDAVRVRQKTYSNSPYAWQWAPIVSNSPFARGYTGYIETPTIRLFRNHKGYHYRGPIFETIRDSILESGGRIAKEDIILHHYGYCTDKPHRLDKLQQYLDLAHQNESHLKNAPFRLYHLAQIALVCGRTDEAINACNAALRINSAHLPCIALLANIFFNEGDYINAKPLLQGLERAGHRYTFITSALGAIACREGRLDEAKRRLESTLINEPKAALARIALARVYDRLGDVKSAHRELEVLNDMIPGHKEFRDRLWAHDLRTRGESLFQVGEIEQAIKSFEEGVSLDPEDPILYYDLGVAQECLGQDETARRSFQHALQLAPGFEEAQLNLEALIPD